MASNYRQKKSSSYFNIFKSKRARRGDNAGEDPVSARKVFPSDEDKGVFKVAEPGIDRKATEFINRFHESRVSESERHYQGACQVAKP